MHGTGVWHVCDIPYYTATQPTVSGSPPSCCEPLSLTQEPSRLIDEVQKGNSVDSEVERDTRGQGEGLKPERKRHGLVGAQQLTANNGLARIQNKNQKIYIISGSTAFYGTVVHLDFL